MTVSDEKVTIEDTSAHEGLPMEQIPKYEHDCETCRFLGRYRHDARDYDLYFCAHGGLLGGTVIARGSSEDWDNTSGIPSALIFLRNGMDDQPVVEAFRRAIARGLLPPGDNGYRLK
jgi:hypothetical protein